MCVSVCVADFQNGMCNLFGPVTTFNPPGFVKVSISTILSAYFCISMTEKKNQKLKSCKSKKE